MIPGLIRLIERRLVFWPERALKGTPEHVGLEYQDLHVTAADGVRLHGWHIPGPSGLTFIYFHGNGGNISARLDWMMQMHRRLGAAFVAVEYRGYGLSQGVPSEPGIHLDAQAALRVALELIPAGGRMVYFGRSMGGAVAARLATERTPHALILEAAPPSLPEVAGYLRPWMRNRVLKRMMQARFETARYVPQVTAPVLVIAGMQDDTSPPEASRRVFDAANEPKAWLPVTGAGHNGIDLVNPELYYGSIASFLNGLDA